MYVSRTLPYRARYMHKYIGGDRQPPWLFEGVESSLYFGSILSAAPSVEYVHTYLAGLSSDVPIFDELVLVMSWWVLIGAEFLVRIQGSERGNTITA